MPLTVSHKQNVGDPRLHGKRSRNLQTAVICKRQVRTQFEAWGFDQPCSQTILHGRPNRILFPYKCSVLFSLHFSIHYSYIDPKVALKTG